MTLDAPLRAWGAALANLGDDPKLNPPDELRAAVIASWWGVCETFGVIGPNFVKVLSLVSAGSLTTTTYVIPTVKAVGKAKRRKEAAARKAA